MKKITIIILCLAILVLAACSNKTITTNPSDSTQTETIAETESFVNSESTPDTESGSGAGTTAGKEETTAMKTTIQQTSTAKTTIVDVNFTWKNSKIQKPEFWDDLVSHKNEFKRVVEFMLKFPPPLPNEDKDCAMYIDYEDRVAIRDFDFDIPKSIQNDLHTIFKDTGFTSFQYYSKKISFGYQRADTPWYIITTLEYYFNGGWTPRTPSSLVFDEEIAPNWVLFRQSAI